MATSPVIEWRASTTPFAPLSSLAFTGSGYNGAIVVGTSSAPQTVRIYNNFAAATGIADANSCTLACYDDTIHQGAATTPQCTNQYLQVQVLDYNGNPTDADSVMYAIGGSTKHAIAVNGGTISGTGANYVTLSMQIVVPAMAAQGAISQGVWLEYSSSV